MDAASAALFEALTGELESSSWLVLVTRQDAPAVVARRLRPPRIELDALSREDAQALAQATPEAAQVPPHVLELAVERSGGSPEFLLDLLAAAAAGDRDELPESVGAATMARIDALDPRDGAVVRRAAVLGINFHPRRLADVLRPTCRCPTTASGTGCRVCSRASRMGTSASSGPALQEVAYSSLPFKLRRELHLAVGLRLEHDAGRELDAGPAILSHHFSLAGDYAPGPSVRDGGRRSGPRSSSRTRTRRGCIGARSRRGGRTGRRRLRSLADAWEQLGDALRHVGEPAAAAKALTEARRLLPDDPIAQARLCHRHADIG